MLIAGRACLFLALALCVYGAGASIVGVRTGRADLIASGRRAVYALALVLTLAFAILESAFLRSDFTFRLVGTHSSTNRHSTGVAKLPRCASGSRCRTTTRPSRSATRCRLPTCSTGPSARKPSASSRMRASVEASTGFAPPRDEPADDGVISRALHLEP